MPFWEYRGHASLSGDNLATGQVWRNIEHLRARLRAHLLWE